MLNERGNSSIRDILRQKYLISLPYNCRILQDVFQKCRKINDDSFCVLVLSERSTKVINSILDLYDVTQEGIYTVELISKKREKLVDFSAIYILEPSEESVTHLIKDFETLEKSLYRQAFIYFLTKISETQLTRIKQSKNLFGYIKLIAEINLDFTLNNLFTNTVSLNVPLTFPILYQNDEDNLLLKHKVETKKEVILTRLVSLCASINEYPYIKYTTNTKTFAKNFQDKLNLFIAENPDFEHTSRGTLLIVDRSEDLYSPLLHSFGYKTLLREYFDLHDNVVRSPQEPKRYVFSGEDDLLSSIQFSHMVEVLKTLQNQSIEGKEQTEKARETVSIEDLANKLHKLPELAEQRRSLLNHLELSQNVMSKIQLQNRVSLADKEQVFAGEGVGFLEEKVKKLKPEHLLETAKEMINLAVDKSDRLRTLGLSFMYFVTHPEEMSSLGIDSTTGLLDSLCPDISTLEMNIILNLKLLLNIEQADIGNVNSSPSKFKKIFKKKTEDPLTSAAKDFARETNLSNDRFKPVVLRLCENEVGELNPLPSSLNMEYIIEPPTKIEYTTFSLRSGSPLKKGRHGPRLILFVLGGISDFEVQKLYSSEKLREVNLVVVSTDISSSSDFLWKLEHFSDPTIEQQYEKVQKQKMEIRFSIDKAIEGVPVAANTTGNSDDGEEEVEEVSQSCLGWVQDIFNCC
eukprot:snap_masked-scaffold_2-processed-gene-24.13-mRNA-1 protein AED:1.00 eAED:1.00 QI:0/0/0/0/1/1/3/0/688